jgi:hypothetical protein
MLNFLFSTAVLPIEAQGGCKDRAAPLSGLYRSRRKALPIADPFNVIYDGELRIPRQYKIAVHAMDGEVLGDRSISGG